MGAWEDTLGVGSRKLYSFNGQVIAQRDASGVTYFHTDHLGSVSIATDSSGALVSKQEFDPWGQVRSGNVSQTSVNYTGQRLDGTGLLFYNARYYDPAIGRFLSADSVVPGNASGGMEGVALRPLMLDFHEPGFVNTLNTEGAYADKLYWGGPANPQSLNRYSYVLNNPLRWTDPSGHTRVEALGDEGRIYGYEEARNSDGSIITDEPDGKGNILYQAYICNSERNDCTVALVWSDSQDFKDYKSNVDSMLVLNREIVAATATTAASLLVTGAVCAGTGAGCLSLILPAVAAGVVYYKIGQLHDATLKAQKSFGGLWAPGSKRTVRRETHVLPYDYDKLVPEPPIPSCSSPIKC